VEAVDICSLLIWRQENAASVSQAGSTVFLEIPHIAIR